MDMNPPENCQAVYPNQHHLQRADGPELVDTHCHLDCSPLYPGLQKHLSEALEAGVTACVIPGVHPNDWDRMAAVAQRSPHAFPAFGIHPMHAAQLDGQALQRLGELSASSVAVGEIGLDPGCPVGMEVQECAFRDQLRLAVSLGLPVLVHCRQAFERTLKILQEEQVQRVGGIMHAFSGSSEMARLFIRCGLMISVSGTITWQGAVRPVKVARDIPLESLVLETDAPDMTPAPYRGRFNRPAWLKQTLGALAELKGLSASEVAEVTTKNARRILPRLR